MAENNPDTYDATFAVMDLVPTGKHPLTVQRCRSRKMFVEAPNSSLCQRPPSPISLTNVRLGMEVEWSRWHIVHLHITDILFIQFSRGILYHIF